MFSKVLRDLARPHIVAIVDVLKRSDGLAVGDIAQSLKMSYMGVKQYCIELEKRGYLDTWRRPRETGRPELTYRLTAKAQVLFPQHSNELSLEILDAVRQLHGVTAAEKILYQYFLKKTDAYCKKVKGKSLIERATALSKMRDAEGHCAQIDYDATHGLRLTEFHSPLAELIKDFPSVARMEEALLSKVLQAPVQREVAVASGLTRITFLVAGASLPPPPPPASGVRSRPTAHRRKKSAAGLADTEFQTPAERVMASALRDDVAAGVALQTSTEIPSPTAAPSDASTLAPEAVGAVASPTDSPSDAELSCSTALSPINVADLPAPPESPTHQAAAPHSDRLASATEASEPLLFAPPVSPSPRIPQRAVTPPRVPAKPSEPAAEELFLSL